MCLSIWGSLYTVVCGRFVRPKRTVLRASLHLILARLVDERSRPCRWDTDLVEQISSAIAAEARLVGIDLAFSPVINMWVDARFGRLQEGYSENPTLTSAYATAAVRGFQGNQPQGKWEYFNSTKVCTGELTFPF